MAALIIFMYVKSGLNERDLKALAEREDGAYEEDRLPVYEELNRLTAN